MFSKILKSELQLYRQAYRQKSWPKHLYSYGLLDHFVKRFEKLPEWEEKVQFLKPKNSEASDGTFAFINGNYIYFDTFEPSSQDKLCDMMNELDYSSDKVFTGIRDVHRPLVEDLIRVHNLEKTFDTGARLIHMRHEKDTNIARFLASDLVSQIPKGFYHAELKEEDADLMDSVYAQRFAGSKEFIKTAIRMNPTTGIYKDNGELIAWIISLEVGAIGNMQVLDEYKRNNIVSVLAAFHWNKVVNMGSEPYGFCVHSNLPSFNFMVKKHEGRWVGNNSWIGVKPKAHSELAPLWGI